MKANQRLTSKTLNFIIIVLVLLILITSASFAQHGHRPTHIGGEASFGINGFTPEADNFGKLRAMARGTSVGFIIGNPLLKSRIRAAGLYLPTERSQSSGKIMESEALVNFYPLEFLRTHNNVLDIYFTTGFRLSYVSLSFDQKQEAIGSAKQKGKIFSQISGIGGEYRLPGANKFRYLFAEMLLSNPIGSKGNTPSFINVWTHKSASVNFGVRFGTQRKKS